MGDGRSSGIHAALSPRAARDPGTPGTRHGARRPPVAEEEWTHGPGMPGPQSQGSPHPLRAGHGQVHGSGQQADSTPGDSAGYGGT